MDGRLLPHHNSWHQEVMRDDLYDDYVLVTGRLGLSRRGIATELGILLSRLLPPGYPRRFQRLVDAKGVDRGFASSDRLQRRWFWGFPPLPECRQHFDRMWRWGHPWQK